jgi:hypothetical protein
LYLTNDTEIVQVVSEKNEIQIVKTVGENNGKEIIIPYGTDLTNLESRLTSLESRSGGSSSFRQSIIDNVIINNPTNTLKDIITNNQDFSTTIKILVGEGIYPKTSHTLLTVYYTSYIDTILPVVNNSFFKTLLYYRSSQSSSAVIQISVINSSTIDPQLYIKIYNTSTRSVYKEYRITKNEPKVVIDLTTDLAVARPGQYISSALFTVNDYGGNIDDFYRHCVNILSSVFISYTYDD